ncbi:hypothetical protein [Chitinophaga sp. S165]|uniref:hypothetical protein n=1 Tax=Chitinophaga sp. S165 TaxID=2135462 RepID=UPI000D716538|nr:hypothetical protein [Chitinophaga sp. S165]PWV49819.1 hypothetical protein C7475_105327 [Chitinophaga sp. S165]
MKKILVLSLFALAVISGSGCGKDSIGTKPMLSFLSYSSDPVIPANGLEVRFQVKDGDGDIENEFWFSPMYDTAPEDTNFTSRKMPDLEAHNGTSLNAEVLLQLDPIDLSGGTGGIAKDSLHFLIYIVDNANNISDTISTPKVEVIYQ